VGWLVIEKKEKKIERNASGPHAHPRLTFESSALSFLYWEMFLQKKDFYAMS
jgi:hypothetical protein